MKRPKWLRPPQWLKPEAKEFYHHHSMPLVEANLLTERDHDSYCLLAQMWALMITTDCDAGPGAMLRFISLSKQYQTLSKQFAMAPKDRIKSNLQSKKNLSSILKEALATKTKARPDDQGPANETEDGAD